jgi:hypothetical protein
MVGDKSLASVADRVPQDWDWETKPREFLVL